MGLTGLRGVGLVDLLLADWETGEVGEATTSKGSSARGLGSKASTILFAVFMARDCDGGTGTTGSLGSGKVLERFLGSSLGNECGGGFIANALGGEVGVRAPERAGLGGEELEDDCCCCCFNSGLVRSKVGEVDTRGLIGADVDGDETRVGSTFCFEMDRVWDIKPGRAGGEDEVEDAEGSVRALLAAVGRRTLLVAKGTVGLAARND